MYKAVINDNYLCHYNKNHSKANGQFVSGDGDGDGISNDHANQNKKKIANEVMKRSLKGESYKNIKGDISKGTWKNNAGVNLKFVSPKGLKSGYWIDANTGKRASAGNQWRQVPKEFRKRERGKALFWVGVAAVTYGTIQAGIDTIQAVKEKKYREQKQEEAERKAAEFVERLKQDMWREAASKAKFAGGDW